MILKFKFSQDLNVISLAGFLLCTLSSSSAFCMDDALNPESYEMKEMKVLRPAVDGEREECYLDLQGLEKNGVPSVSKLPSGDEKGEAVPAASSKPISEDPALTAFRQEGKIKDHTRETFYKAVQRIRSGRGGSELLQPVFGSPFCTIEFLRGFKISFDNLPEVDPKIDLQYRLPICEAIWGHADVKHRDKLEVAYFYLRLGSFDKGDLAFSTIGEMRNGLPHCKGDATLTSLHQRILENHYREQSDVDAAVAFALTLKDANQRGNLLRLIDVPKDLPTDFTGLKAIRAAWIGHNRKNVKTIEEQILAHSDCKFQDLREIRDSRSSTDAEKVADRIVEVKAGLVAWVLPGETFTLDDLRRAARLSLGDDKTAGYHRRILETAGHEKVDLENAFAFAGSFDVYTDVVEMVLKDPLLRKEDDKLPYQRRAINVFKCKKDEKRVNELWRDLPLDSFNATTTLKDLSAAQNAWFEKNDLPAAREPLEKLNTLIEKHGDATITDKMRVAAVCMATPSLSEAGERKLKEFKDLLVIEQVRQNGVLEENIKASTEAKRKKIEEKQALMNRRSKANAEESGLEGKIRQLSRAQSREKQKEKTEMQTQLVSIQKSIKELSAQIDRLENDIAGLNKEIESSKANQGMLTKRVYKQIALLLPIDHAKAVEVWELVLRDIWETINKLADRDKTRFLSREGSVTFPEMSIEEMKRAAEVYEARGIFDKPMTLYVQICTRGSANQIIPFPDMLKLIQLFRAAGREDSAIELCKIIQNNSSRTEGEKKAAYDATYGSKIQRATNYVAASMRGWVPLTLWRKKEE